MGSDFSLDLPAAASQRVRGSDDWIVDLLHPDPEVPDGKAQARSQVKRSAGSSGSGSLTVPATPAPAGPTGRETKRPEERMGQ
jgi:hypothetical protein